MRVLGEHPCGHEPLARLAAGHQRGVDVDAGPEAPTPYRGKPATDQLIQRPVQDGADLPGPLLELA